MTPKINLGIYSQAYDNHSYDSIDFLPERE